MPFWDQIRSAVKRAIAPLRPANISGPIFTEADRFGALDPRVAEEQAQAKRVAAYEQWQRQGARRGIWTNYVAFVQIASGQWIPVHSSNVSAFRWTPIDRSYQNATLTPTEELLAERRLAVSGPHANPMIAAASHIADVGPGHGTPSVNIRGQYVDVRDTSRIRSLLTPAEWRQFQNRMLEPVPSRAPNVPVQTGGLRKIAPTARGKKITADTMGIFFIRFHDSRVYMYPSTSMSEALDFYQAPSKGKETWVKFRWAGKPYQQISGPAVKYRMGQGR